MLFDSITDDPTDRAYDASTQPTTSNTHRLKVDKVTLPNIGTKSHFDKLFDLRQTQSKSSLERAFEPDQKFRLSFQDAVRRHSGNDRIIFLSTVDSSYVPLALNLYLTSFAPFNISNYLFVGIDQNACRLLTAELPVTCIWFFSDVDGNQSSNYGSVSFRRKTHYKTKIILETLLLGVTAVIVDLDIVFFKNPLPFMTCATCDIQIQSVFGKGNSGFYMARPTNASIELHENALKIGDHNPRLSNQNTLRPTMDQMQREKKIKIQYLDSKQFPTGLTFYEDLRIMFADDVMCKQCVIVHNAWIITRDAKIYRFRETGMWQVDTGGYYSDPKRKYLAYENPTDFGPKTTLKQETDALRGALYLGWLLNRTVILPEFHCYGCNNKACNNTRQRCSLNTFYKISDFNMEFADVYREHVFLRHPKVPESVKRSQSVEIFIGKSMTPSKGVEVMTLTPSNVTLGPSEQELRSWFAFGSLAKFSVLRFRSLYDVIQYVEPMMTSSKNAGRQNLTKKLSRAFKKGEYRQG